MAEVSPNVSPFAHTYIDLISAVLRVHSRGRWLYDDPAIESYDISIRGSRRRRKRAMDRLRKVGLSNDSPS